MANEKISALNEGTPVVTDHTLIARGTASNHKILISALVTLFQSQVQTMTNKTFNSFTNSIDADRMHHQARNVSGSTITKGSVVYDSGYNIGQELVEIELADSDSAATMPAGGIAEDDIANNASGDILSSGVLSGIDTSAFTANDALYVSGTAGGLTTTKPTGTALIQKIAVVLRSHATLGIILILPSIRTNDLPNVPENNVWVGNASAVPTANTMAQLRALIAQPESFVIAASDESTVLTTGTKLTFRMPYAFTLTGIRASLTVAGTGATLVIVDVHDSGTTIMTTDKLEFDDGAKTTVGGATEPALTDTALADDAEIEIIVDQVDGATTTCAGLKVTFIGTQA